MMAVSGATNAPQARMARTLLLLPLLLSPAAAPPPFVIDADAAGGRPFDGVGGLSGGGATSKLLPSYPPQQRSEILDALFKENHLASLSLLKIEIGGDTDSTEGSESSHMHSEEDLDCTRGYEFWLASQAKLRNPRIRIYGLPWGFPHWLAPTADGGGNALNETNAPKTVKYIANWVACARSHWNLTIDFLGPWNEKDAQFAASGMLYIKALRVELDSRGFQSTKLVAGDVHTWIDPLCDVLVNGTDAALDAAVAVIGKHYPSTVSGAAAKLTGKPLWASEDYAANSRGAGGRCEARILNQNWVNGLMTATVAWNLITSYYSWTGLGDAKTNTGDGLMTANTPWSGSYSIDPPLFSAAHTTQFAVPGMTMLANESGSGFLGSGGSFVTYFDKRSDAETASASGGAVRLPLRSDAGATAAPFSMVLEKVDPDKAHCSFSSTPHYPVAAETASFQLSPVLTKSMAGSSLTVTKSNFANQTFFKQESDITIGATGTFSVDLLPDDLVTLTNTVGQKNGNTTTPPADAPFPAVHADDFVSYAVGQEANYFAQASGAFEVAVLPDGNRVLKQSGEGFPVLWLRDDVRPVTQLGAQNWYATNVSAMVSAPAGQGAFIAAHIGENNGNTHWPGCFFGFDEHTWWMGEQLAMLQTNSSVSGPLPPPPIADTNVDSDRDGGGGGNLQWRRLELRLSGTPSTPGTVTALIDGHVVHTGVCASVAGTVGLGSIAYAPAFFDNFSVSAVAGTPPPPGPAPGPQPLPKPPMPEKCAAPKAGDPLLLLRCTDTQTRHKWAMGTDGKLQLSGTDLCLSIDKAVEGDGTELAVAPVCTSDEDCQLNGICSAAGKCDCDAMWEGEHCESIALTGPGSFAYGGTQSNITSWGGGPPVFDPRKKEWVLFVTEIANHCGLAEWQHQSTVVKTTAAKPEGPYKRERLILRAQAHNP